MAANIPDGFAPHDRRSPVTEPWQPIYQRVTDDRVILAIRAAEAHCNARGFVHGGLISALSDNAMGLSGVRRLGGEVSLVTVTLNVDFLASAQIGQWLAFDTVFVRPGGTLTFAQAFVTADGEPCARANAVFRVVRKAGAAAVS